MSIATSLRFCNQRQHLEDISIEFAYYKARAMNLYKKLKDLIPKADGFESLPDDRWVTMKCIYEAVGDSFSANEIEDMVNG